MVPKIRETKILRETLIIRASKKVKQKVSQMKDSEINRRKRLRNLNSLLLVQLTTTLNARKKDF